MINNDSVLFSMVSKLEGDDPMAMTVSKVGAIPTDVLKSVLIMSLLALTLISSLLPFALRRAAINHGSTIRRRHLFASMFSLLSCFGGGVFLGTCLLDLFPDTRELIKSGLGQLGVKSDFPLAEFFVAIGFFIVLFIEQIVLFFREKRNGEGGHGHSHGGGFMDEDASTSDQPSAVVRRRHTAPASRHRARSLDGPLGTIGPSSSSSASTERHRRHYRQSRRKAQDQVPIVIETSQEEEDERPSPPIVVITSASPLDDTQPEGVSVAGVVVDEASEDIETIRTDVHFDPESHSTFRAVMLVMALSTHATFEGLALGLQTNPSTALQIFGALCIHKCVIAFSLGMRLVQSRLTTLSIVGCCLLFCVSAVIGGFMGLAITESVQSSSASMVNGSLQGLACGTFLYITAFEILPHELNEGGHRMPKLIMLLLGFTVICLFVLFYPS